MKTIYKPLLVKNYLLEVIINKTPIYISYKKNGSFGD